MRANVDVVRGVREGYIEARPRLHARDFVSASLGRCKLATRKNASHAESELVMRILAASRRVAAIIWQHMRNTGLYATTPPAPPPRRWLRERH